MSQRFYIKSIHKNELQQFLDEIYYPSLDLPNSKEIFENTVLLAHGIEDINATNVIHVCYDNLKKTLCDYKYWNK